MVVNFYCMETAMSLSLDLRRRIVEARDKGLSISQTAKQFSVGTATVKRLTRMWREEGSLEAGKSSGREPILDDSACEFMRERLANDNDLTLGELCSLLSQQGYTVTVPAVFYCLKRIGLSYKKNDARQ